MITMGAAPDPLVDVEFLLRLLEAQRLVFTRLAVLEHPAQGGQALVAAGLLKAAGHEKSYIDPDDEDGTVFTVNRSETGRFGFRHPLRGWTDVDPDALRLFQPDLDAVMTMLLEHALRRPAGGARELVVGLVWEVGLLRLATGPLTTVWLARRLGDRATWDQLQTAARQYPATGHRLVLTPTRQERLLPQALPGTSIVPIADVLDPYEPARISLERLQARFEGRTALVASGPVHLSEDGAKLNILNEEIYFGGTAQQKAIRLLVDSFNEGRGVNAAKLLEEAGFGVSTRTFRQAFRHQWPSLGKHLKSHNRMWRIEI